MSCAMQRIEHIMIRLVAIAALGHLGYIGAAASFNWAWNHVRCHVGGIYVRVKKRKPEKITMSRLTDNWKRWRRDDVQIPERAQSHRRIRVSVGDFRRRSRIQFSWIFRVEERRDDSAASDDTRHPFQRSVDELQSTGLIAASIIALHLHSTHICVVNTNKLISVCWNVSHNRPTFCNASAFKSDSGL